MPNTKIEISPTTKDNIVIGEAEENFERNKNVYCKGKGRKKKETKKQRNKEGDKE